jgi:hypothetical protein
MAAWPLQVEVLSRIAFWLAKLDYVLLAAEVCNKIGDSKQLVNIYVQCKKWDDAFALAERQPQCVLFCCWFLFCFFVCLFVAASATE